MFDLKEEIKKLENIDPKNLPSSQKMARIMATVLDQALSKKAFEIFQDQRFRQLADFDKISQVERDRIFNELVLAGITVLMLLLETPDLGIPEELKDYFLLIKDEIPKAHLDQLASYGIEKEHLKNWKELIQMRYEEYREDKHECRKAAMELESREGNLNIKTLEEIQLLLPVQTVAVGCHTHICRSKTKGKDELFKVTLRWLGRFYVDIRILIEGRKVDPLTKAKVNARRFFGDIKHRIQQD